MTSLNARLSVSALLAPRWTFEQDLGFWKDIGAHHVGLFHRKLAEHGHDAAIESLQQNGLGVSCIISTRFNLFDPGLLEQDRAVIDRCVDTAAALKCCTYGTTGQGKFGEWAENVKAYAKAVAPCLERAKAKNVRLALEPSLRPQISFAHNLTDARDIAEQTGVGVVVDIGNCWRERDVEKIIRSLGEHIALVQVSDFQIGTLENPGPNERVLPGEGELPLHRLIEATLDAGYEGQFEIELQGPAVFDPDAARRGIMFASNVLDDVLGKN